MSPRCRNCGTEWATDPRLKVPCPTCRADAGSPCQRPSGHQCSLHADRDRRALDAGHIDKCPCVDDPEPAQADRTDQASLDSYGS